jgi:hypothetical protein
MTIAVSQSGAVNSNSLGFTAVAGRIIVAVFAVRNWNVVWTPGTGWSILASRANNTPGEMNAWIAAKVAAGGETTVAGSFTNDAGKVYAAIELTGATLAGAQNGGNQRGSGGTYSGPAITPSGPGIVLGALTTQGANVTASAGWTGLGGTFPPAGESDWPRTALVYRLVASPAGAETPQGTGGGTEWAAASAVVLDGSAGSGGRSAQVIMGFRRLWALDPRGLVVPRWAPSPG